MPLQDAASADGLRLSEESQPEHTARNDSHVAGPLLHVPGGSSERQHCWANLSGCAPPPEAKGTGIERQKRLPSVQSPHEPVDSSRVALVFITRKHHGPPGASRPLHVVGTTRHGLTQGNGDLLGQKCWPLREAALSSPWCPPKGNRVATPLPPWRRPRQQWCLPHQIRPGRKPEAAGTLRNTSVGPRGQRVYNLPDPLETPGPPSQETWLAPRHTGPTTTAGSQTSTGLSEALSCDT